MSSTKKPSSQKRAAKERQDNRTLNRIYYVFLLGLAAECYLILAYRGFAFGNIGSTLAWNKFLNVAMWVGLALLAAGAGAAVWKKKDRKLRTIMTWAAGVGAFFFVSSWVMTRFFTNGLGVTAMCVLVPILAVLALCTATQRERFLLHALYDFTYDEIGTVFGCSKQAVDLSIRSVRKKFLKFFKNHLDE